MKSCLQGCVRSEKAAVSVGKKSLRLNKPQFPSFISRDGPGIVGNSQGWLNKNKDKEYLPSIIPIRKQKERRNYVQQFEDTGVTSIQRKQLTIVKVTELRSNLGNEHLRPIKTGYKGSKLIDKRKLQKRNKIVKSTINKPKSHQPISSLIEPEVKDVKELKEITKECKSYNDIQQFKLDPIPIKQDLILEDDFEDSSNLYPKELFKNDKSELQKLKEADGLRHFMWPITPLNLEEEEEAFFKSDFKVNPQFLYQKPKLAARFLKSFKKPDGSLLSLAVKIIEAFLKTYGSESNFLLSDGGEILSLEETKQVFQEYIDSLELGEYLKLDFSYNTVSPTTISHIPKSTQSVITIGLPVEYRKNRIEGVLNHEVGTHFLRNYNDKLQSWYKPRRKRHLRNYLSTEEGLASLNQLFHIVNFNYSIDFNRKYTSLLIPMCHILLHMLFSHQQELCRII